MPSKVEKLVQSLPALSSIEDLGVLIDTIRDVFDVRHAAYLAMSLGANYRIGSRALSGPLAQGAGHWWRHDAKLGAGSYVSEWGAHYAENGYERIDPVVEGAIQSFAPVNWRSLDWSAPKRKKLLNEALDAGLGNQGYTIPLRGPNGQFAVFVINSTCADDQWQKFLDEHKSDLLVVSHFFHQKVLEIEKVFGPYQAPALSARELDVLRLIATGKNRAHVADTLKISENTLRVYLDSARHKLGALNIPHAIAVGITRGIISI